MDPLTPVLHASGTPLEVVVAGTPFEQGALSRRLIVDLHGVGVPLVAPGDLIVYKLVSDRSKDYDDAVSVIRRQAAGLDAAAIRGQLREAERAHDRSDLVSCFEAHFASALRSRH